MRRKVFCRVKQKVLVTADQSEEAVSTGQEVVSYKLLMSRVVLYGYGYYNIMQIMHPCPTLKIVPCRSLYKIYQEIVKIMVDISNCLTICLFFTAIVFQNVASQYILILSAPQYFLDFLLIISGDKGRFKKNIQMDLVHLSWTPWGGLF